MAPRRDSRVASASVALALPVVVVALVIALGVTLWGRGDLNRLICDGDCGPANVIPPTELASRPAPRAVAPLSAEDAGPLDPAKVTKAVEAALGSSVLGPHVGFAAVAPDADATFAASGPGTYVPASTTKVLTSFAALSTIDPQTRFTTKVVRSGRGIVLVGGGDPYLSTTRAKKSDDRVFRADLTTLARRTASALKKSGTTRVTLGYDASLFTGPDTSPTWPDGYVTGNIVTPVSALWADEGVINGIRSRDPARSAAATFAALLDRRGIDITGSPAPATATRGATTVGTVRSATVAQIVETLLRVSDNQAAEVMLKHVAIAGRKPATFAGGTTAVTRALRAADIDTSGLRLNDGSGLSRANRVAPKTLVGTLRTAMAAPRTSGLLADLPVSGFTGTLVDRFADLGDALGTVRAKTGTLTGVHALAGYALDADGRPVVFALMADRSDKAQPVAAQAALDRVAAAIAACHCG